MSAAIWVVLWPTRLFTLLVPVRLIARFFGEDRGVDSELASPNEADLGRAQRVFLAMDIAVRHHPLKDSCYAQAIIAHAILRALSIEHAMIFGLMRESKGAQMKAHAWVTVGNTTVCGGHCSDKYTPVRCYVS